MKNIINRLSLNAKLLLCFLIVGLVPFTVSSWSNLRGSEQDISREVNERLQAVTSIKQKQVENYFKARLYEVELLSNSISVKNSIVGFGFAMQMGGREGEVWKKAEEMVGLQLTSFKESNSYKNLMLISAEGVILYSVNKGEELEKNLVSGNWKDSSLAKAFNLSKTKLIFQDFAFNKQSGGVSAYLASPVIRDDEGERTYLGSIIFEMVPGQFKNLVSDRTGLGSFGESYLVGNDNKLRSDSLLDSANFSVKASFKSGGTINTSQANSALNGESGVEVGMNYLGRQVVSAYRPVNIAETNWAIVTDVSTDEAFESIDKLKQKFAYSFLAILIILVAASAFISNSITKPVKESLLLLGELNGKLRNVSEQILTSSCELSTTTSEQAAAVQETSASIEEMSSQSRENADNAKQSSNAVDDMSNLLKQSVENIRLVSSLSTEAKSSATLGTEAMSEIVSSMRNIMADSLKITEIVRVIDDITQQTKMLATNAAIEAARAGEQGKGFAVVANEVSKLAENSKKSASEITELIRTSVKNSEAGGAHAERGEAVLKDILEQSVKLADLSVEVATASKEQEQKIDSVNMSLRGIETASQEQAKGVEQISLALNQIDNVTQQNATTSDRNSSLSHVLKEEAEAQNAIVQQINSIIFGTGKVMASSQLIVDNNNLANVLPVSMAGSGAGEPDSEMFPAEPMIGLDNNFDDFSNAFEEKETGNFMDR